MMEPSPCVVTTVFKPIAATKTSMARNTTTSFLDMLPPGMNDTRRHSIPNYRDGRRRRVCRGRRADQRPERNGIGLGMAAPTILAYGSGEQQQRWLRPLWTGEEIWCQLFSEPGAGSDLAGARDPGGPRRRRRWVVNGQKVWTSSAHMAQLGDAGRPHRPGRAQAPRPDLLRLRHDRTRASRSGRCARLTGEAEFNEVFLTDVRRARTPTGSAAVGEGWQVATATLMNERVAIGGGRRPAEGGMIGVPPAAWREHPELRTPGLHDRLLRLWADAEVARLAGVRLRQQLAAGQPGPGGVGGQAGLRPAEPGDLRVRGRAGRRRRAALRRLDDAPAGRARTSSAVTPATGTCGPRATRSRAAPRRSCATSSPSECSGCPRRPGWTPACRGRTCPDEREARDASGWNRTVPGRRAAAARPRPAPTCCTARPRPSCAAAVRSAAGRPGAAGGRCWPGPRRPQTYDTGLWHALAAEIGCAGLLIPEGTAAPARRSGRPRSSPRRPGARWPRVPFLGSAVVATAALLAAGDDELLAAAGRRRDHGGAGRAVRGTRPGPPARADGPARRARPATAARATGSPGPSPGSRTRCPPTCCWFPLTACLTGCTRCAARRRRDDRRSCRWT